MIRIKKLIQDIRFSIGLQINCVFGFMILLFIVFSIYNHGFLNRFNNTYSEYIKLNNSILELKDDISESDKLITEYLNSGNKTNLAHFNNISKEIETSIKDLLPNMKSDESIFLLYSIQNSFITYFSECSNASFLYNTNSYLYYEKMYYAQRINLYLQQYCDELLQLKLEDSANENIILSEKHEKLTYTNILIIFLVISFFFLCVMYINLHVMRPITELVGQAKEISMGNFHVKVKESKFQNTISILSSTFNDMAQNIRTMMESIQDNVKTEKELLEEQRKNMEYENLLNQANFLALQSQTNPHFLFNTLNSISRTITLGKEEQAILMIDSLATLLRYNLTNADLSVTLAQEISITKEYLRIQKLRFSDRIDVKFFIQEDVNPEIVLLPRFTLQPLVENSIIHGLEPKEKGGYIGIRAKRRDQYIVINVFDSGVGISKEKLKKLRDKDKGNESKCIGIFNTKKRIRLFTGKNNAFKIYSKKNVGTLITIWLLTREE